MTQMERLLSLCGIPADYLDYGGERREIPWAHRVRALRLMGYETQDPAAIAAATDELEAEPWRHWLQSTYVVSASAPWVTLRCTSGQLSALLAWELQVETGATVNGQCLPGELPELGEHTINDVRYSARKLPLPPLPAGYHTLHVVDCQRQESATVTACPERFYGADPQWLERGWGISCQLYTLRSARNWGVGDFSDLMELLTLSAAAGADLIGLNPLHAPCAGSDDAASPYSPSDRRFLNPLYIDPEQEPE
ncbi:MAG TPA: 4-alpha-glucanotransferase, partial [Kineobactrum sp.]